MKENRTKCILTHYEKNFGKNLSNYEILDWESKDAQYSRFSILAKYVDLNNLSLLDVGCGLADLYSFFNDASINVNYVGVDISELMIKNASSRFPNIDFRCVDIFSNEVFLENSFDVVFSSGIFNLNLGNNVEFLSRALKKFYFLSKKHIVFNLLSEKSTDKEGEYFYYTHREICDILKCVNFSSTHIVEDYLSNDLTIICTK